MEFHINQISLHHIDIDKQEIKEFENVALEKNFNEYINNILLKLFDSKINHRFFEIKSNSTQVVANILKILNGVDKATLTYENSKRLLEKETKAQERIARLKREVQKGSLIHIQLEIDSKTFVILTKVEFDEILTERYLTKEKGLNTNNKIYKAFIYCPEVNELQIFDNNLSKFWWDDFLELKPIISDDDNTKNSYQAIDSILLNQNDTYHTDIVTLREHLLAYYKTNTIFKFDELLKSFKEYKPHNKSFPISSISDRIENLTKKGKFDTHFNIKQDKVTKTTNRKIKVNEDISISIKNAPINTLSNHIVPFIDEGSKILKIYTDQGYDEIQKLIEVNRIKDDRVIE